MIDYYLVQINNVNFAAEGNEEILQNLKTLYTTPSGTVPFDRDFGINVEFLDAPIPLAQGRAVVEYTQITKKYEPRVTVKEVNFDVNPENGKLIPKVVIDIGTDS